MDFPSSSSSFRLLQILLEEQRACLFVFHFLSEPCMLGSSIEEEEVADLHQLWRHDRQGGKITEGS